MKKRFEIKDDPRVQSMTVVRCPSCKTDFALDNGFLERVGDVNIHYSCPYCGHEYGLKKD